jgi:hypothetical protein
METLPDAPHPAIPSNPHPAQSDGIVAAFLADAKKSSLLDTQELSVGEGWENILRRQAGAPTKMQSFRHSGWSTTREAVIRSMFRTRQSDSRIMAFLSCGNSSWIERAKDDPTRYRIRENSCHDRLCQVCGGCRARRIADAIDRFAADRRCRFITLTLTSSPKESLKDLIDRLMRSFRYLRSHPTWEKAVDGGCAFLEIKRSDKAHRWHPHLHILAEGRFLKQSELSDAWRSITKDSYIVDVRDARMEAARHYITKYASKPLNASFSRSEAHLDEAMESLKGRRLVTTFGTWYGTAISSAEDDDLADDLIDAGGYHLFMGLEDCFALATAGDAGMMAMIRSMPGGWERYCFFVNSP